MALESPVREKCIKQLKKDGWFILPLSDKWRSGYPDIICFKFNGQVLIREFKRTSGGVRSKLQIYFIKKFQELGFDAKFVTCFEELYDEPVKETTRRTSRKKKETAR